MNADEPSASKPDDRVLVDTNIVVYAYDPADPTKHRLAGDRIRELSDSGHLVLSTQVLNEFARTIMRPNRPGRLGPRDAAAIIRRLAATAEILILTSETTELALALIEPHSLSFWDALICATARLHGVETIVSEDYQHDRVVEGVRYVNPFLAGGSPDPAPPAAG